MKRLYVLVLVGCALGCAQPGVAGDDIFSYPVDGRVLLATTLQQPSRALSQAQVLKGRFTHHKHLSELPQPLAANGDFTFARDLGVYWHTQKPFDSAFILTSKGIVQRDEGTETLRMSADDQPAVRVIANIFSALFTLDMTALSGTFDVFSKPSTDKRWSIGLKPKSTAIAGVFKEALISGATEIEQVILIDKHGDRTVINLHEIDYSNHAPSAEVRALFKR
ncbi:MAG: outer membrane lipoprotein carrier protein LolA [Candidatus Obscuribacterales bacterium]|nr:outer membrane lipoprotein carrier protein LolA [Steroidobacteraceae bacterium]